MRCRVCGRVLRVNGKLSGKRNPKEIEFKLECCGCTDDFRAEFVRLTAAVVAFDQAEIVHAEAWEAWDEDGNKGPAPPVPPRPAFTQGDIPDLAFDHAKNCHRAREAVVAARILKERFEKAGLEPPGPVESAGGKWAKEMGL